MRCCHSNVHHLNRSRVGIAPSHPALAAAIPRHVAWSLLPDTHLHWACAHHTMLMQPQSYVVPLPLTQSGIHAGIYSRADRLHRMDKTTSCNDAVSTVQKPTCGSVLNCGVFIQFWGPQLSGMISTKSMHNHQTHTNFAAVKQAQK